MTTRTQANTLIKAKGYEVNLVVNLYDELQKDYDLKKAKAFKRTIRMCFGTEGRDWQTVLDILSCNVVKTKG